MHITYIINETVEFDPSHSTLRDLNNPERVVVLNYPVGRCLLLLIENTGSIVSQQEFMDIVWQGRGMLVSPNTYYQNIYILRKGMKKIGFETDPIVTIPRIGLTLSSDTRITFKEVPSPCPTETEPMPLSEAELIKPDQGSRPYWFGVLFAVLLSTGMTGLTYHVTRDNHFVDNYHFAEKVGECQVYLSVNIRSHSDISKALGYVGLFKEQCGKYPWVYISQYGMLPRASVIRCDGPMTEMNRCVSDYFIDTR
ncbi:transcriptional regulator [Enterobacter asburiae]